MRLEEKLKPKNKCTNMRGTAKQPDLEKFLAVMVIENNLNGDSRK
jgi:hypothetical protein